MQFLQPIWLWASAGILVPLIVHLWSVKSGKVLKVGSILLLTESAKSHATSFKLSELFLLLLRCLLLILLAILMAKPFYAREASSKEKGWILMERSDLKNSYGHFRTTIDSLTSAGYAFRYFEPGFERASLKEALQLQADSMLTSAASYWTLLKLLDQQTPASLPVYLFTGHEQRRFSGDRPLLNMNLHWQEWTRTDTAIAWLYNAYQAMDDSIRIIKGVTNHSGVWYTHATAGGTNSNLRLAAVAGSPVVIDADPATALQDTIAVDTTNLKINIYAKGHETDARYVKAAVNAIRDFTKRKLRVSLFANAKNIPDADWLFWLSEEPTPASLKSKNLFRYEPGTPRNSPSFIRATALAVFDARLYKKVESALKKSQDSHSVWEDGDGNPVLNRNSNHVYSFYSRFDPAWNDLVWSSQFPLVIYNLLFPERSCFGDPSKDARLLDPIQLQPVVSATKQVFPKEALTEETDLSRMFWIAAFILFVIERLLVFRKSKPVKYG